MPSDVTAPAAANKNANLPGRSRDTSARRITNHYPKYVLGVLFTVYIVNFIDRQVLSVFIGPIKAEFGVSDTAMGFLVGFSFSLFYSIAGIPIARWADRGNRTIIVAVGLGLWSLMTVASGFARNFILLAIARVGVGVGEAAGTPPSHSIICDYFPPHKRATALGIYSSGVYVGSAIAYLCGGFMRANFDWRMAFILLGIPGLLFAFVVKFTVREPERGLSETLQQSSENVTLKATFSHLFGCRSWVFMMLGVCCLSISGYGALMWGYEFYVRVHSMDPVHIGFWMAFIVGAGGCLTVYVAGRLIDHYGQKDPKWLLLLPAMMVLVTLPTGLVFVLAPSSLVSLLAMLPFFMVTNFFIPAIHTVNQSLAKLRMRATAAAIVLFAINIFGAGAGPFVVGLLSDMFSAEYGSLSIQYSLLCLVIIGVFAAPMFYIASKTLAADLARVTAPSVAAQRSV